MLAFELLNEPQYYKQESRYNAFARRLVAAIRKEDGQRLLIVGAPRGSSIEGMQLLDTIDDPHIAYDVHFYEPYIVTAQGYPSGFEKTMLRISTTCLIRPTLSITMPGFTRRRRPIRCKQRMN